MPKRTRACALVFSGRREGRGRSWTVLAPVPLALLLCVFASAALAADPAPAPLARVQAGMASFLILAVTGLSFLLGASSPLGQGARELHEVAGWVFAVTGILMTRDGLPSTWLSFVYTLHDLLAILVLCGVAAHVYLAVVANPGALRGILDGSVG